MLGPARVVCFTDKATLPLLVDDYSVQHGSQNWGKAYLVKAASIEMKYPRCFTERMNTHFDVSSMFPTSINLNMPV
ncbi:hypothetical protein [Vibrio caribbeanicus]|uniref:hypothetical protein n=1 Tax=Vibrio caribbeanicus TaxID=701175 RepID=UPI0030DA03BC